MEKQKELEIFENKVKEINKDLDCVCISYGGQD